MRPYFEFLNALSEHNQKEWMDTNKKWYLSTREEFMGDVDLIIKGISFWEPGMEAFKPKDCVFRINRDVRFSANKDPYKTNFAAYFSPEGKKSEGPGYYLNIKKGASMIGGGIWMPMADTLKKIRKEIDYSGGELKEIEADPDFQKLFGEIKGERLKSKPRGYEIDHKYIDYLRLKSFTVFADISDQDVLSGNYIKLALDGFRKMKPFLDFLKQAVDDVEDGSGIL